ncbi:MAG: hypothetical protein ABID84_03935 [Chloroflexota bacterium]
MVVILSRSGGRASHKDGVLSISFTKPEARKARQLIIDVGD